MSAKAVKDDLQPGDTLGAYRLETELGEGAMGTVYRAHHVDTGTQVALKVVRVDLATDERYRQRFLREARAASEVKHPNLVDVLDAGEVDGRQFLAMRFVRGRRLEQHITDGALEPARIVRAAAELGGALDALHAVGLNHRDVKASNVFLDDDEVLSVALTDFCIAKGTGYAELTRPGQIIGTLDYLAPERIRGEQASAASDIYGLGCVIFECVRGRTPFGNKGMMEIAFAHLEEEPEDPCAARVDIGPEFGAAVNAALAKDPADRPPSATAYADLLRAAGGV